MATNAPFTTASPNPNRLIPGVRYTASGTITSYQNDGAPYTYQVVPGDSVVQRRFPLGRLAWIGPNGPQNGGTAQNIQACFGLVWGDSENSDLAGAKVWKYVGPTGSSAVNVIKTLSQIADEGVPREPNFFELLQAGILAGSLGVTGEAANTISNLGPFPSSHQANIAYQVLRIGACMIDVAVTGNAISAVDADHY